MTIQISRYKMILQRCVYLFFCWNKQTYFKGTIEQGDRLTSIQLLSSEVIPVEQHDFYLVTFIDGHQANKQQENSTKPSSKFNGVH